MHHNTNVTGIIFKILNLLTYSVLSIIMKLSLSEAHIFQVIFILNISGLILTSLLLKYKKKPLKPLPLTKQYVARTFTYFFGTFAWVSALGHMPINEATAISYLTPIIAALFGASLLKERLTRVIILPVVLSFIGMLIILKPLNNGMITHGAIFALISAISWAAHDLVAKLQSRNETWLEQAHTLFCILSAITIFPAIYVWDTPLSSGYIALCTLIGILAVLNKFFFVNALSKTDLVILAPITFLRLVFTSAFAYILFGEIIDLYSIIGVVIIVYSTYLLIRKLRNQ